MKTCRRKTSILVLSLSIALLLAGCATTPAVKLYVLSGMARSATPAVGGSDPAFTLGLGPVTLPDYLDRPQLMTRASENRLEAADFHRWAEPLASNITRVLAENLSAQLAASHILTYPWKKNETPDYQVRVEVTRFEAGPDDAVSLVAHWSITGRHGAAPAEPRRANITVAAAIPDFEAMVRAQSEALSRLSEEIAEELRRQTTVGRVRER